MKVIIELENDEELEKLETFLKDMKAEIDIKQNKTNKLKAFFDFADDNPITDDKLEIPDREERNAR